MDSLDSWSDKVVFTGLNLTEIELRKMYFELDEKIDSDISVSIVQTSDLSVRLEICACK